MVLGVLFVDEFGWKGVRMLEN